MDEFGIPVIPEWLLAEEEIRSCDDVVETVTRSGEPFCYITESVLESVTCGKIIRSAFSYTDLFNDNEELVGKACTQIDRIVEVL